MTDRNRHEAPNPDDATRTAFAEIPFVPAAWTSRRPASRTRSLVVSAFAAMAAIGIVVVAYLARPTDRIDPNAPRVVAEVIGMHCPIQCGLRVASALEKLPFVLPGSVTANPRTGVVTFAVTSADTANEARTRGAIEKAGFGVRSVKMPDTARDRDNPRTALDR